MQKTAMFAFGGRPNERTRTLRALIARVAVKTHAFLSETDDAKKAAFARELLALEKELKMLPKTPF